MANEVSELLETYLRILYSPNYAANFFANQQSTVCEAQLKPFINQEYLAVEQYARFRNFIYHLKLSLTLVNNLLTEDELSDIIKIYLDAPDFWDFKGRSLLENFCLFAYKILNNENKKIQASLIMLQGVVAGLMNQPEMNSPWEHVVEQTDTQAKEIFLTDYQLISSSGKILSPNEVSDSNTSQYQITVIVENNQKVEILCQQKSYLAQQT